MVSPDLHTLADTAARELENASAEEILTWTAETFGDRFCVLSSMTDAVVISLASAVKPGVPVIFLDTGYHFPETLGTRDAIAATYDIRLVTVRPDLSVAEQDAEYGKDLFARDPDLCCQLRKVVPLDRALEGYDAWVSGIRRDESPARASTPVVAWDARRNKVRIHPIARWTQRMVDDYIERHHILVNPLVADGYPSIGCRPCTVRARAGDPRSGRWVGFAKTECGIHS